MLINLCYCLTNAVSVQQASSNFISKHLMLLFNAKHRSVQRLRSAISKHLMLLFNQLWFDGIKDLLEFQNISCYCLTYQKKSGENGVYLFQNISCYCLTRILSIRCYFSLISKHLMLLFNINTKSRTHICYNFKTSHVIV